MTQDKLIIRAYQKAWREAAKMLPSATLRSLFFRLGGVSIGRGCNIARKSRIGRSVIHKNVRIGGNVCVGRDCVIKSGSDIRENAVLLDGLEIGENVIIGKNSYIVKAKVGDRSTIEYGTVFTGSGPGRIVIGEDSYIGINNVLDFSDDIKIGNFVHIAGPSTALWTHTSVEMSLKGIPLHQWEDKSFRSTAPIVVEDNVYIGCNCTIYPGVTIARHSVVAPNSAVSQNVEPYTMVGGVPAKVIRNLQ
jgi:acetyltransferase-like isoleucine patch superfamily enzyme